MKARSRSRLLWSCFLGLILILQLPAIWYSVRTPFTVVDDPSLANTVAKFSTWEKVSTWFNETFIDFSAVRFRPAFDLYNYVTWRVLGPNAGLHHLFRLVLKLVIAVVSLGILRLILGRGAAWRTGAMVFLLLFLFYPNCPEARLGPVELLTVCALALNLWSFFKMSSRVSFSARIFSKYYILLALSYLFLLGSKETNILFGFWLLVFYCLRVRKLKFFLSLLPLFVILGYVAYTVYRFGSQEGYGRVDITGALFIDNLRWYGNAIFLTGSLQPLENINVLLPVFWGSVVFTILFHTYSIRRHSVSIDAKPQNLRLLDDRFYMAVSLFLGGFATAFATVAPSPAQTLRYAYPAAYLMIMILSLSLGRLAGLLNTIFPEANGFANIGGFRLVPTVFRYVVVLFSLFVVAISYHSFLSQYLVQYRNARYYDLVTERISWRLAKGYSVHILDPGEREAGILWKLREKHPEYEKAVKLARKPDPRQTDLSSLPGDKLCYVRRFHQTLNVRELPGSDNWTNVEIVADKYSHLILEDLSSPWILKTASRFASMLQGRDRPLKVMYDAGAWPDRLAVIYEYGAYE